MQLPAQSDALADHQHPRAMPGSVGSDALQTNSVTADKIATDAVGSDEIAAGAVGTSELASAVYGTGTTTIDPDDATAHGVSSAVSRTDHQHQFTTAAAAALTKTATSSEGAAASAARSDHVHSTAAMAWGQVARDALTSNSSGFTTAATTDHAIAGFVAPGGRRYRAHWTGQWNQSAGGDWSLNFHVDGTLTKQVARFFSASGNAAVEHRDHSCYWEPGAGTYNLDLRVVENAGAATLTLNGTATVEREFWIEDIGST